MSPPLNGLIKTIVVLFPIVLFMAIAQLTGHLLLGSAGVAVGAVVAWWLAGGRTGGVARLGLGRPASWLHTVGEGVLLAVAAGAVLALVGHVIASRFGVPNLTYFASMRHHPGALAQWLLITWTTAAFGEEIIFRGFLIPLLSPDRNSTGRAWAVGIVLSSVLFGLAHSYQGAGGAILSGTIGAVLGIGFVLGRPNLWRTIIAHGLFDSVSLVLLFIQLQRG